MIAKQSEDLLFLGAVIGTTPTVLEREWGEFREFGELLRRGAMGLRTTSPDEIVGRYRSGRNYRRPECRFHKNSAV